MPTKRLKIRKPRPTEWPLIAQVIGSLVACFGVGMLVGLAWALIVGGVATVAAGALVEADQ